MTSKLHPNKKTFLSHCMNCIALFGEPILPTWSKSRQINNDVDDDDNIMNTT